MRKTLNDSDGVKLVRGFTLIELIIVVLLMMLMLYFGAGLLLPSFQKKEKPVTPLRIKTFLSETVGYGTLICTGKKCDHCYMRHNGQGDFKAISSTFRLGKAETYRVNLSGAIEPVRYGRFKDRPICLVVHRFANGATTPLLLQNDQGVFYLPSALGKTARYDSLEEAKEAWLQAKHRVLEERLF